MKDGRPLRFLAAMILGWAGVRAAMLWPGPSPLEPLIAALAPPLTATALPAPSSPSKPEHVQPSTRGNPSPATAAPQTRVRMAPLPHLATTFQERQISSPEPLGMLAAPSRPVPIAHGPTRLAGSSWLLARGGGGGTLSGGQLGASQAGVRITYALGRARRVALAARLASPLEGSGKEAAIGLEWTPTTLPFRLVAEQRFALDGGRGGPTVGIIGGYGPATLRHGLNVEAYGQAGAIARDGVEGFVDSAARLTHAAATLGQAHVDLGAGLWLSAQRGATRFDMGPTIGLAVPVARRNLRLSLDWRERIAGQARPGSEPAFTIGSDF